MAGAPPVGRSVAVTWREGIWKANGKERAWLLRVEHECRQTALKDAVEQSWGANPFELPQLGSLAVSASRVSWARKGGRLLLRADLRMNDGTTVQYRFRSPRLKS